MKIKVILKENIKGVGKKDEIVEVKDGYANNFLFAQNKGIPATPENIKKIQAKQDKLKRNHDKEIEKAEKIKEIIEGKEIEISVKAGNNQKVFGSVGSKEISEALKQQLGVDVDKKKISTDTRMKELGLHIVELKLHSEVKVKIKVMLKGL